MHMPPAWRLLPRVSHPKHFSGESLSPCITYTGYYYRFRDLPYAVMTYKCVCASLIHSPQKACWAGGSFRLVDGPACRMRRAELTNPARGHNKENASYTLVLVSTAAANHEPSPPVLTIRQNGNQVVLEVERSRPCVDHILGLLAGNNNRQRRYNITSNM